MSKKRNKRPQKVDISRSEAVLPVTGNDALEKVVSVSEGVSENRADISGRVTVKVSPFVYYVIQTYDKVDVMIHSFREGGIVETNHDLDSSEGLYSFLDEQKHLPNYVLESWKPLWP